MNKVFYLLIFILFQSGFFPEHARTQVELQEIVITKESLYNKQLELLIEEQKLMECPDILISKSKNPFISDTTEEKFISRCPDRFICVGDECIVDVLYLNQDSDCTFMVSKTLSSVPYSFHLFDESENIGGGYLGDEVKNIFIHKTGNHIIYIVYHYDEQNCSLLSWDYFAIIQNTSDCSYNLHLFQKREDGPMNLCGPPLKTYFEAEVEFKTVNDNFFVYQHIIIPERKIRRWKFVNGKFVEFP